jgi:AraC-like DNA-binding protein
MNELEGARSSPPKVEVHLAANADFDAFEPWHASLSSLFFDCTLTGEQAADRFRGDVVGYHFGESVIFHSTSTAQQLERDPSFARRSAIDHIMIEYQIAGRRRGDYADRNVDVRPGDVSFLDFSRTVRSAEPDFSRVSLIVPRDELPASLRERDLHGVVLDGSKGATRLLGHFLRGLVETASELSVADTAPALEAAFVLAETTWGGRREFTPEQEKASRPALRQIATAYIDRNLADAGLTPQAIAQALRMSRATLYRLFESDGGIRAYILARRLDRCFDALAKERNGRAIGALALSHGFASEAHFSRAFRSRFGVSAQEVRGMAGQHPALWWPPESGLAALATMPAWVRTLGAERAVR